MILFNALLGYSGEATAFDAVRRSQDNSGRWWRSAMHVDASGAPTNYPGSGISFSKDHTLGVLLYLVATPDREMARMQAKAWIHYIQKQREVKKTLKIGTDIPDSLGYRLAKFLINCTDGFSDEGCAVREDTSVVKDVWEKVRDCISHPDDCWAKVQKHVVETIDREIGYLTHDVCPEPSFSKCTISPSLWFLFHRVWRDHLGLSPSPKMEFWAHAFQSDLIYDQYVAWEARGLKGYHLHLKAVNGLIRGILGKPSALTITTAYTENSDNPFFQFLMHKYVNNHLHPHEEIRGHLLSIAPSRIDEFERPDGTMWFRNEDGGENSGNEWAWEREDVRSAVRNTMGWDCIFIGNLLVREFALELDYYVQNMLPDLLRDRKRMLNEALSRLAESYGPIERVEAGLGEFIEKSVAIITHPNVSFAELEQLTQSILERHRSTSSANLRRLHEDHSAARAAYESFLRLKEEVRRKFQHAERLSEFGEMWGPQMTPYADTENLLRNVGDRLLGKTACLKLAQILAAIPLRIEQEKISGTNKSLREVEDHVVADLKIAAKDLEYGSIKTDLNWISVKLAESLQQNRIRRRYNRGADKAEELGANFQVAFARNTSGTSLLTADDLAEIRHDAAQIIEREQREWDGFVAEFGVKQIIAGRLQVLNARAARQFEQIHEYSHAHRKALYFQWRLRAEEAGYQPTQECRNAGTNAYRQLSCWQFRSPADLAPRDEWILFDMVLDGVEQLINDFSSVGRPIDRERAPVPESARRPATGVFFDVQAEGTCSERIQTTDGVRFRGCRIPPRMQFRAASVSPSGGNPVIESLTFFNRLVILANGESLYPASVTAWLDGRRIVDQALQVGGRVDVDLPVPYAGAMVELTSTDLNEWNVFKPETKVEIQENFVYPDVRALKAYGSVLGKYTKFMARIHRDLSPGAEQSEVIASLEEGIELLVLLLDRDDLDLITRRQIETARDRMSAGKLTITQACGTGGPELCTAQIRAVRESLSAHIETATGELSSLREFLGAEVQRLLGVNDSVKQKLQAILDELANPESIRGIQPFLVCIPRDRNQAFHHLHPERAHEELFRTRDVEFFRGEEITFAELYPDCFTTNITVKQGGRYKATQGRDDLSAPFSQFNWMEWCSSLKRGDNGDQGCGTAIFEGIAHDMLGHGRSDGPIFSNNDCGVAKKIDVGGCRVIASYASMRRAYESGCRSMRIRAILEFGARPFDASLLLGALQPAIPTISCGIIIGGSNRDGRRTQYGDYEWKTGQFTFHFDIDVYREFINGDHLCVRFNMCGRVVQFNSLTCQLLNPF